MIRFVLITVADQQVVKMQHILITECAGRRKFRFKQVAAAQEAMRLNGNTGEVQVTGIVTANVLHTQGLPLMVEIVGAPYQSEAQQHG
jgi:hypothetical protein